jgi:hypothetical protein
MHILINRIYSDINKFKQFKFKIKIMRNEFYSFEQQI